MAKTLQTSGNYTIKTADDGVITLDTGLNIGQVRVTGDLIISGQQTTVNSTNLNVADNIIVINANESGTGITLGEAGIRIERGSLADVQFLFNESIVWNDPVSNTTKTGAFVLKDESGGNIGLEVRSISTGGGDLFLINSGTGVISVSGTNNYENSVTDDDDIPNLKKVNDRISYELANYAIDKIRAGSASSFTDVVTFDDDQANPSTVTVRVDGITNTTFYDNRAEIQDIRLSGNKIETTISSADLILSAPGTGSVVVDDQLKILSTPGVDDATVDPVAPADGLVLYVKAPGIGKTGLFYVNSSSVRDEIISKNRSLLLSMIF